jgi:protein strawberry notch
LRADRLGVVDRRTVHVHGVAGAETQVFVIERRDRNVPMSLADTIERAAEKGARLLVNSRSGRAAVQVPAPSLTLDDGSVERRVRLIRPMERHAVSLDALVESNWDEATREAFSAAWAAELAEVPEFSTTTFSIVTGLLLPI